LLKANITGKAVLVTGAGGSIGSELCRQIVELQPGVLVLYELNEFALYSIEQELLKLPKPISKHIVPILGSVTDPTKLALVFERFAIQTVFHAAAYKHVPMVEKNPCAGAFNNILGTWHTARAARDKKVETFVLVSTDKAVRPTNTMGTTKRVAELVLQALAQEAFGPTRFVMVRFGNVLGSSGSVVPVFREQIKNGGPITVTDPRIIRYFMTIPEAAQLVIQAGAMGHGGDVFVLDMGEPVKILDMAQRMVHLSGLTLRNQANPAGDIEIVFSGLRPGEKLYEELLIGDNVTPTRHPRIQRANEHKLAMDAMVSLVDAIDLACNANESDRLRELLLSAVKEFQPQCGNEDLLH
jgi:UDP-N-acetylglucosamine 4,6-dehydratase